MYETLVSLCGVCVFVCVFVSLHACVYLCVCVCVSLHTCEVGTQHQHHHQEGPAEDVLPAPAQAVAPAAGAADPVLHCSHRVCSLHFNNCLVWIGHQTGQEQTPTYSQVCRKDHWCQPAHHPRPVHLQSQETGRKNHCRPLTPRTQTIQTPPLW